MAKSKCKSTTPPVRKESGPESQFTWLHQRVVKLVKSLRGKIESAPHVGNLEKRIESVRDLYSHASQIQANLKGMYQELVAEKKRLAIEAATQKIAKG